ncbi:YdiU family protein [uncultured Mycolicibacterium sp.]|mgnify:CR=1 FL=1|uniref:protein adenylyltransferase SelO n=1 Tax=uncultured Mycolicibacterium sp. TaxID=2320817 RepID=UPI0026356972|nr:YdiU family protein [uncultured Mycolicibacterium sp.]
MAASAGPVVRRVEGVSTVVDETARPGPPPLGDRFARELPELAVPWRAEPVPAPRLLLLNTTLATELGLDPDWLAAPDGVAFLVGANLPAGAAPVAQAYAGHQFGGYAPRLGDGRALLLGELVDPAGRAWDLHLKGSGATPFARGGDGYAAVGPMLREYVVAEAMHALGIPTTRALAVVATGRTVYRETALPGAVLVRVAASHLRVGTFQYAAQLAHVTDDPGLLRRLADHAIDRHHPDAARADNPYLALFEAVVTAQARLVARWMLAGFVHGVMNTDNTTISGETIDYGPCAFLDGYHPATVFSSIDTGGRYAYGNQPAVAVWNLARFAEALLPLIDADAEQAVAAATAALHRFGAEYRAAYGAGMAAKLGLPDGAPDGLADELLELLAADRVDFTSFFRALGAAARGDDAAVRRRFADPARFDPWLARWRAAGPDPAVMDRVNPVHIPRNHLVEEALAAAEDGDLGPVRRLLAAVTAPFDPRPDLARYAEPAPPEFGPYRTFCGT